MALVAGILLAAIAATACSSDDGLPAMGEPEGRASELSAAPSIPPSTAPTPPQLRAAQIAAEQAAAPPSYALVTDSAAEAVTGQNAAQRLSVELAAGAIRLHAQVDMGAWSGELRWTSIGRDSGLLPVDRADRQPEVSANKATWRRSDGSEEWYANGPLGLQQGFVLQERPAGSGDLLVEVTVSDSIRLELSADGAEVSLQTARGRPALRYTDLYAYDATGTALDAGLEVAGDTILLRVEDQHASYPLYIDPLMWTETHEIMASDGEAGDGFGASVSVSGDWAIAGASGEDSVAPDAGAAYVYYRHQGGPDNWGQVRKLTASDAEQDDSFGFAVAISGDTAIVGAFAEGANLAGAAYVFGRDVGGPDNWGEIRKIISSDLQSGDRFGVSVAIDGDVAIVGANSEDTGASAAGAAYILYRNQGGPNNWGQVRKVQASDLGMNDQFGRAVGISADVAIVGAWQEDTGGIDAGAAYVLYRDQGGLDNWGEVRKIMAADAATADEFGYSVAISGDVAIVGADRADAVGSWSGAAYLFERNQGGADNWGQIHKLLGADTEAVDFFGHVVAISGDSAIVGASGEDSAAPDAGAAYTFHRLQGGPDNWGQVSKLSASDAEASDAFGGGAAVSGDTALVGASGEDTAGSNAGAVYVFSLSNDKLDGEPCVLASECVSGSCVDGVCCATPCAGGNEDCQACSVAAGGLSDGTCGPRVDGSSCDDGIDCNGADQCQAGNCDVHATTCQGGGGAGGGSGGGGGAGGGAGAVGGAGAAGGDSLGGGGGTAGSGGSGTMPPSADPDDGGGCGCELAATRTAPPPWAVLGLLGFGLAAVRRHRRS